VSKVYRLTFKCAKSDGTLAMPSVHYKEDVPGGGSNNDPSELASKVWDHVGAAFKATFTSSYTVQEILALEETVPPVIGAAGAHTVNEAGTLTGSGDSMPDGCVAVINIHTNTRSRSARGWFHPPSPRLADRVSGNAWDSTMLAAFNALCAVLDDTISEGGTFPPDLVPVVYSRTRAIRAEDPFAFDVVSLSVNPRVHWLKSRMSTP